MKKFISLIIMFCVLSTSVYAAAEAGLAGSFLDFGAGARPLGMGKAYTALSEDATGVYWNPAGLAFLIENEITAMHAFLFESTNFDFLSYVQPLGSAGTFGVGVVVLSSTGFEETNSLGDVTGSFNDIEAAVLLSYGINILNNLSCGVTAKIVHQEISSYKDTGIGADVGLLYKPAEFLGIGCNVMNALPARIKLKDDADTYPLNIKFGIAVKMLEESLNFTADAEKNLKTAIKLHAGAEYWPFEFIALRAGLDEVEITGGIGIRYKGYSLDYAVASQNSDLSHRVSFSVSFGEFDLGLDVDNKIFSPFGSQKEAKISLRGASQFGLKRWSLNIKDKSGNAVKSYGGRSMPPGSIVWDGKDSKGDYVPDGKYKIELELVDKKAKTEKAVEYITIETNLPNTDIKMEIK